MFTLTLRLTNTTLCIRGRIIMTQLEKATASLIGRSQAVRIPAQPPMSMEEIFAALDEVGVPEDFLSPAERARGNCDGATDLT
jgi:hypothetical protein